MHVFAFKVKDLCHSVTSFAFCSYSSMRKKTMRQKKQFFSLFWNYWRNIVIFISIWRQKIISTPGHTYHLYAPFKLLFFPCGCVPSSFYFIFIFRFQNECQAHRIQPHLLYSGPNGVVLKVIIWPTKHNYSLTRSVRECFLTFMPSAPHTPWGWCFLSKPSLKKHSIPQPVWIEKFSQLVI